MPNLRHSSDLPLRVVTLHLWHLHLVPGPGPLAGERVAEAKGVELKDRHGGILSASRPFEFFPDGQSRQV
jgi:hypothetical protein